MNAQEVLELKKTGFMLQNDGEHFTVRVKVLAGNVNAEQMTAASKVADKYGRGYVGLTVRMGIEIPWIRREDVERVRQDLEAVGLVPGGTGKKVRGIVACKGTICAHGLCDSQELARQLDVACYGMELPAKFKIVITGCPNNCVKIQTNDLGFMGKRLPKEIGDSCSECGKCIRVCKAMAIQCSAGRARIDYDKCVACGKCVDACATDKIVVDKKGLVPCVGGKFGRFQQMGRMLDDLFLEPDDVVPFALKVLKYYAENAEKGERLGNMINRLGFEKFREAM